VDKGAGFLAIPNTGDFPVRLFIEKAPIVGWKHTRD
jgi:hypothetical protein